MPVVSGRCLEVMSKKILSQSTDFFTVFDLVLNFDEFRMNTAPQHDDHHDIAKQTSIIFYVCKITQTCLPNSRDTNPLGQLFKRSLASV